MKTNTVYIIIINLTTRDANQGKKIIYIFTIRFRHLFMLINIFQTHRAKLIKFLDLNNEFTRWNSRNGRREDLYIMR